MIAAAMPIIPKECLSSLSSSFLSVLAFLAFASLIYLVYARVLIVILTFFLVLIFGTHCIGALGLLPLFLQGPFAINVIDDLSAVMAINLQTV